MKANIARLLHRTRLPFLAAAIVCAISGLGRSEPVKRGDDVGSWWIEITSYDKAYRVRPNGSEWTKDLNAHHRGAVSPDGKRVVYSDPAWRSEIYIADVNGSNARQLTKNEANDDSPNWTPDGKRIVFESDRSGGSQVYVMDTDGANVRQLTQEKIAAQSPKLAPDGRLTYLRLLEERCKGCPMNLMVRDPAASRPIVEKRQWYTDYAWSPDGKMIAYGNLGKLVFHVLATGKKREVNFAKDINSDLYHHGAFSLAWRPDGQAIACSIHFVGGRTVREGEKPSKLLGDEEIFIIPLYGRPTWFTARDELPDFRPQFLKWFREK